MSEFDRLNAQLAPFAAIVDRLAPADPLLADLRERITTLRGMADGTAPAATTAAARAARNDLAAALTAFINRWKREFSRAVFGGLPELPAMFSDLANADWFAPDGFSTEAELGPLKLGVGLDQIVMATDVLLADGTRVVLEPLSLGFSRLERLTASLSGPFPGDGALRILHDGFSGALRLPLGPVTVDAIASLRRTVTGGPSFLAVIGAAFTPGIQLPLGFAIDRVGGVVGVERRVNVDALSLGIRTGAVTDVLFSPPESSLERRLIAVETLFPPAPGRHVVGPLFGLAWLSLGPDASLVHADIGVLVQFGGPVTIVIVGSGRLRLSELLRIQADLAGSLELSRGRIAIDVSLVEARVLGAFRATGDATFRAFTSDGGATVFSAGGFYPGFDPKPVEIGSLRRLSFGTDIPTPGLSVRIEGYFATTSNTIQLGGRLDVVFDAALIVARGSIELNALVQLRPFHIHTNVYGAVCFEFLGNDFCGVRVEATVDGPGPMSVAARLTIETFLKDIPWDETFSFGGGTADRANRIANLAEEIANRAATNTLTASAPDDPAVVLTPLPVEGVVLGPLGELTWTQRHSPLNFPCDRFEGEPLDPRGQGVLVDVTAPAMKLDDVIEPFAPGSFLDLPENLAMHYPAFDRHVAGMHIGFNGQPGDECTEPLEKRKQPAASKIVILPGDDWKDWNAQVATPGQGWFKLIADVGLAAPQVWDRVEKVTAKGEVWSTADGALHTTLTSAWQSARHGVGGLPLHTADPPIDTASF